MLDDKTWVVLIAAPGEVDDAEKALQARSIATVVPRETRYRRKHKYSKARVEVHIPMLHSYILAGLDHNQASTWRDIEEISGAVSFGEDGAPARLRPGEVTAMQRLDGAAVPHTRSVSTRRAFRAGDAAEIGDGPLRGVSVVVEAIDGTMARVEAGLFGKVTVPLALLTAP